MTLPSRLAAVLGSLTIIAAGAACAPPDDAADAAATAAESVGQPADGTVPSYDSEAVAANIVTASLRVREGEAVLITGSPRDRQLLEDLAVQARRQGAHPLVRMVTDRMRRGMVVGVPERFDTQDRLDVRLELFDVMIVVENGEDPALFADVSPERMAAIGRKETEADAAARNNGVRTIFIGNGIYPTAALARETGVAESDLARMFWSAVSTDPASIDAEGRRIRAMLEGGTELRVTAPNGTDLTLRIANPRILISDGAISPEEEAVGGASTLAWLPGGELFFVPVQGSASGTAVLDAFDYDGVPVEGLKLTFQDGRMTSMDAASRLDIVRKAFDAASDGKDLFGPFDIGLNPGVTVSPDSRFRSWVAAGMVSVGIGNNTWAGGTNDVAYGLYGHIAGATVTVDGRPVVENGQLVR
jgi:leucyl aminopeptidase (aminopeptidase T)